jgi:hypothetical protein
MTLHGFCASVDTVLGLALMFSALRGYSRDREERGKPPTLSLLALVTTGLLLFVLFAGLWL